MSKERIEQLKAEYVAVKADVQTQIAMIKAYIESIQNCRARIDEQGQKMSELQQEYLTLTGKDGYGGEEKQEEAETHEDQ